MTPGDFADLLLVLLLDVKLTANTKYARHINIIVTGSEGRVLKARRNGYAGVDTTNDYASWEELEDTWLTMKERIA